MKGKASPDGAARASGAGGATVLRSLQAAEHARCVLCGGENRAGLQLAFSVRGDGTVWAPFHCHHSLQGYGGVLHGGIISALLDAAMTNCLFARGIRALTAELSVRYLAPVTVDCPAEVTAALVRSRGPLHCLSAELRQDSQVRVRASAKFLDKRRARSLAAPRSGAGG